MASDISTRDKISSFKSALFGVPEDQVCLYESPYRIIKKTVAFSEFTDGGGATGTYTIKNDDGTAWQIPVGAIVTQSLMDVNTAFVGGATVTITIGDGTTADRYNTGTPSLKTAGQVSVGAVSGTAYHSAAKSVKLTVTDGTAFSGISAGVVTITVIYIHPVG